MNKRTYVSPLLEINEVNAVLPLATSGTGATIPDAGWGNARQESSTDDIWSDNESEE